MTATVQRWTRCGKDRLYVTAEDGTKLGYRDLTAQTDHLDVPQRAVEFLEALAEPAVPTPLLVDRPAPAAPVIAAPEPAPWTVVVEELDEDLAQRVAGHAARQQAEQHRQAAPVRTLLARAFGVHTEERAWRLGAKGESLVGKELDKLEKADSRWHALHAVPIGERGADIDHVLIGPAGVLTLNAKHHPDGTVWVGGDTVLVNGQRQPYVRNSRHEARRVARLLDEACGFPVPCRGVVVPVGCTLTVKQQPEDVIVVGRRDLRRWLTTRPQLLGDSDIEQVFVRARRSSTWRA